MPNPPIPDKDGYFGREFTYTEVEQEYLEAIFHMQIRALAFSRVGTEAIRHHLSKGEKLDYVSQIAPAQFAVKALHFCNGLFLNCNDNAKPEELRSLTAIMDRAIECSTVDEFEDILHRLRDDLTRQVQARMEVRTQRRAAARCN